MAKHKTNDPLLQQVYDVVHSVPGVHAIDGRSTNIFYTANVKTLEEIVFVLSKKYGKPTGDHPLLNSIKWDVRKGFTISINKACSLDRDGVQHPLHVFHF